MKVDDLGFWLVIGIIVMHSLGHGDQIDLVLHNLGVLAAFMAIPALFVAWLALGHDKRIAEEQDDC